MFRLATCMLDGRKVLLVEDDEHTAALVSAAVSAEGGIVLAIADTVEEAVERVGSVSPDVILLHIRYVQTVRTPICDIFRPKGIEVEFLACFDDWFEFADDDGDGDAKAVAVG